MTRYIILNIILFASINSTKGQAKLYDIQTSPFLTHILRNSQKIDGTLYWGSATHYILGFKEKQISKAIQNLVITNNAAYITVDGTGIVYEKTNSKTDKMTRFTRIDSTLYAGNCFNSLSFGYNNQLYSIGGYGFWKSNGQLRFFSPVSHDWNIIPLNKELTITKNDLYPNLWYDQFNQQVISIGYSNLNQSTSEAEKTSDLKLDSIYCLNLKTKNWVTLGIISENFKNHIKEFIPITNTEHGLLVSNNSKIDFEIWDIRNNVIKKLPKSFQNGFPISGLDNYNYWYIAPYVYYSNKNTGKIDSIFLKKKEIEHTQQTLYNKSEISPIFNKYSALGIVVLLFGLISYIYYKRKVKKIAPVENSLKTSNESNNVFSEIEKSLINLIITNMNHNRLTSIDEVNYALGISNKSVNMQKRTRSDVINSINSKYQLFFKKNTTLILRKNSEFDQRTKEFYVDLAEIDKINELL
ncbi:MAG: hypothetical protein KA534_06170 [Sediminibacterium sp.]|nr:hypothetical protein [Sediminibacterium sp.]